MDFLNLTLLAGTVAGVLPVVIHLIHREQPRVVPFTALRFIHQSLKRRTRRLRLRHLLLLLVRVLLIVLFAMALARPIWRHGGLPVGRGPISQAVVILDDSYGMGMMAAGGRTHFDLARERSAELVRGLPEGSSVSLVLASQDPIGFTIDLASVLRALDLAQVSTRRVSCPDAITRAQELLARTRQEFPAVYVFSNLSAGAWQTGPSAARSAPYLAPVTVVNVAPSWPDHIALVDARPSSNQVSRNTPVRIECAVFNSGPARKCVLELFVNDQKRDTREQTLAAHASTRMSFPYEFPETGLAQGRIRIADDDPLPVDNERFFTVQVMEPLRVLALTGASGEEDTFFVAHALSPIGFRGREWAHLSLAEPHEITDLDFGSFDAILLVHAARLSKPQWDRLFSWVDRGGGLAMAMGPQTDPEHLNGLSALYVRLRERRMNQASGLLFDSHPHPFIDRLKRAGFQASHLAQFQSWYRLEPAGKDDPIRPLLTFEGGDPAVIEQTLGQGRILLLATSLAADWSDFPKHPGFPLFLHELVGYLSGRQDLVTSYLTDEVVLFPLREAETNAVLRLFEPGSGKPVTLSSATGGLAQYSTGAAIGNVQVFVESSAGTRKLGYSVNLDARPETSVPVDEQEIRRLIPEAICPSGEGGDTSTAQVLERSRGQELTAGFLLLLGVLLCFELFLANRIYR